MPHCTHFCAIPSHAPPHQTRPFSVHTMPAMFSSTNLSISFTYLPATGRRNCAVHLPPERAAGCLGAEPTAPKDAALPFPQLSPRRQCPNQWLRYQHHQHLCSRCCKEQCACQQPRYQLCQRKVRGGRQSPGSRLCLVPGNRCSCVGRAPGGVDLGA